jgi:GT2 family glycosyltransferase
LRQEFPEVEVILFKENLGFAKGYNEALKKINADYYAILNSDVEVSANWLEPIIELLEDNELNAACQPKILSYNSKSTFEYAGASGGWLDEFGYPFARGRVFDDLEEDNGQYDNTSEVFWASGAALIIKSKIFHQLNGFDELFFAHQEEIDLCWRIQLAGKKVFCCPKSVVYHVGGGTLPKGSVRKVYLNFRNNHIMMAKNLHWSEKWWKIPFRILLDITSALKGLLSGNIGYFAAIIKAHVAYYRWLFSKKKSLSENSRRLSTLSGVYYGNIIWQYFIKNKRKFKDVVR